MNFEALQGHRYGADLHLSWVESFVSDDTIRGKLEAVGLEDVQVYGEGKDRKAFGTWRGASTFVELPDEVAHVTDLGVAP